MFTAEQLIKEYQVPAEKAQALADLLNQICKPKEQEMVPEDARGRGSANFRQQEVVKQGPEALRLHERMVTFGPESILPYSKTVATQKEIAVGPNYREFSQAEVNQLAYQYTSLLNSYNSAIARKNQSQATYYSEQMLEMEQAYPYLIKPRSQTGVAGGAAATGGAASVPSGPGGADPRPRDPSNPFDEGEPTMEQYIAQMAEALEKNYSMSKENALKLAEYIFKNCAPQAPQPQRTVEEGIKDARARVGSRGSANFRQQEVVKQGELALGLYEAAKQGRFASSITTKPMANPGALGLPEGTEEVTVQFNQPINLGAGGTVPEEGSGQEPNPVNPWWYAIGIWNFITDPIWIYFLTKGMIGGKTGGGSGSTSGGSGGATGIFSTPATGLVSGPIPLRVRLNPSAYEYVQTGPGLWGWQRVGAAQGISGGGASAPSGGSGGTSGPGSSTGGADPRPREPSDPFG